MQYLSVSRREIIDQNAGSYITLDELEFLLADKHDLHSMKFIVLSLRNDIVNNININVINYSMHSNLPKTEIEGQFMSKQIQLPKYSPVQKYGMNIINKLFHSPINSLNGISIVAEKPMNNPIMLNSTRTAVLRQMYAKNCCANHNNDSVLRYTYGYMNGKNPAGTDPAKYVTKPFDSNMDALSDNLHHHLLFHQNNLNFVKLDLSKKFNHCTLLVYNKSKMGFHTDFKYNKKGEYISSINSQVEDTATVIVTLGHDMLLHWRRRLKNSIDSKGIRNNWIIDTSWCGSMLMSPSFITVLHALDEKRRKLHNTIYDVQYHHGNVVVPEDSMSIALVFRVVEEHHCYDIVTNCMINNNLHTEKDWLIRVRTREELYSQFDELKYHKHMVKQFLLSFK